MAGAAVACLKPLHNFCVSSDRTPASREDIFKEIDILVRLAHENVVYLKEYFQEVNKARISGGL